MRRLGVVGAIAAIGVLAAVPASAGPVDQDFRLVEIGTSSASDCGDVVRVASGERAESGERAVPRRRCPVPRSDPAPSERDGLVEVLGAAGGLATMAAAGVLAHLRVAPRRP